MGKIGQFEAPRGAEIMGLGIIGIFDTLAQDQIDPILEQHNLRKRDIRENEWYPLQLYYDLYRAIYSAPGGSQNLVAVGKSMAQGLIDSQQVNSIDDFLTNVLNSLTEGLVRNTPKDYGYLVDRLDTNYYQVMNNTGASNDLIFGFIWESVRMLSAGRSFKVAPVEGYYQDSPEGATFRVEWE